MTPAAPGHGAGLAALQRGLAVLGRAELLISVAAFAFVAALTTWQVVLRYGFGGAIWWAQEVAQLAMLVSYFFGIAYVYQLCAWLPAIGVVAWLLPDVEGKKAKAAAA